MNLIVDTNSLPVIFKNAEKILEKCDVIYLTPMCMV